MIGKEEQKKILRHYLKAFWVPITNKDRKKINKELDLNQNLIIVHSNRNMLRKIGAVYLLKDEKRTPYKLYKTYDLIDFWFKNSEEESSFQNIDTDILILYHMRDTLENRRNPDLICHVLSERLLERRRTLLLTETRIDLVFKTYAEYCHKFDEDDEVVLDFNNDI